MIYVLKSEHRDYGECDVILYGYVTEEKLAMEWLDDIRNRRWKAEHARHAIHLAMKDWVLANPRPKFTVPPDLLKPLYRVAKKDRTPEHEAKIKAARAAVSKVLNENSGVQEEWSIRWSAEHERVKAAYSPQILTDMRDLHLSHEFSYELLNYIQVTE